MRFDNYAHQLHRVVTNSFSAMDAASDAILLADNNMSIVCAASQDKSARTVSILMSGSAAAPPLSTSLAVNMLNHGPASAFKNGIMGVYRVQNAGTLGAATDVACADNYGSSSVSLIDSTTAMNATVEVPPGSTHVTFAAHRIRVLQPSGALFGQYYTRSATNIGGVMMCYNYSLVE